MEEEDPVFSISLDVTCGKEPLVFPGGGVNKETLHYTQSLKDECFVSIHSGFYCHFKSKPTSSVVLTAGL